MFNISSFRYLYCIIILLIQQKLYKGCTFQWDDGTELTETDFKDGINLQPILDTKTPNERDPLLILHTKNVQKIIEDKTTSSNNRKYYLKPIYVNETFSIILTDEYKYYENYENRSVISIQIVFQCIPNSEKSLDIHQRITDTNNHYPEFINAPYQYTLSMPYPNSIPLHFLNTIAARDIDLTNSNITFFLNSSDFNSKGFHASWLSVNSEMKKVYLAKFITTTVINRKEDFIFRIYAQDSGKDPLTNFTTISIIRDKNDSIIKFMSSIYVANYSQLNSERANGTIFLFQQGNITLSDGVHGDIQYTLVEQSGEYQQNFILNISPDRATVWIVLINPPKKFFTESYLLLTLSAKKDGADEETTIIHISLPGKTSSIIHIAEEQLCYCTTTIIVMSVFLIIITIALIVISILNWRRTKVDLKERTEINNCTEKKEEMMEKERNTHSINTPRRSVVFNDVVEEIRIAKL